MSDEGAATEEEPRTPRRRKARIALGVLLALVLVTGLAGVLVYRHLNGNLEVVDPWRAPMERPEDLDTGPDKPIRILVMGLDTREGEGNQIDGEEGADGSDTTILLHISADRSRAYGISIPRDSLVTRPDCGDDDEIPGGERQMWNKAFSVGQASCTVEQFELNTQVRLDDMVVVDFKGFKDMVDAIGGVPTCIPYDIDDPEHDIFIAAGQRDLEGDEALDYIRVRDIGDGTDTARIKRQQSFVASMVNKVVSKGMLARPDQLLGFASALTKSLQVSDGLGTPRKLAGLAFGLRDVGLDQVQFLTVPFVFGQGDDWGRVLWSPEADELWEAIARDEPLSEEFTEDAFTAEGAGRKKSTSQGGGGGGNGDGEPDREAAHRLGLCV